MSYQKQIIVASVNYTTRVLEVVGAYLLEIVS